MFYTTTEAAALMTERGLTDRKGGPVKPDTVKHICSQEKFPNAYVEHRGPGRGFWLIPLDDLETYVLNYENRKRYVRRDAL